MTAVFALLSYNQERFIAEAIAGALAQTVPLSIVISDDCSTDDTWQIIQASLRDYRGPHSVTTVRRPTNLGVGRHTDAVIREATADIVILAAGDDISMPHRAARILETFDRPNVTCVGSETVGDLPNGTVTPESLALGEAILGATMAFRRDALLAFPPLPDEIRYGEDVLLPFRASLLGEVVRLQDRLVAYRRHTESIMGGLHPMAAAGLYRSNLQRTMEALNKVRALQIEAAASALSAGRIDPSRMLAETSIVLRQWRREKALRKLLSRERTAIFYWLRCLVTGTLPPRQALKTLIMGTAPGYWQSYQQRRFLNSAR